MYTIETYELGVPTWGAYHEDNESRLPVKQFTDLQEAAEFARNLTVAQVLLARVIDERTNVKYHFDYGEEYTP